MTAVTRKRFSRSWWLFPPGRDIAVKRIKRWRFGHAEVGFDQNFQIMLPAENTCRSSKIWPNLAISGRDGKSNHAGADYADIRFGHFC